MSQNKKTNYTGIIAIIFGCIGLSFFQFQLTFVITQPLTYILLFAVFIAYLSERSSKLKNFIKKYQLILIIILSSIIVGSLFRESLTAKWGPIDDHEIMKYLGEDQKLSFSEIPSALMENTEVGKFGESLRFRPTYYLLRLTETAFWGNNPHLWYGFRLIMLIASLSVFWKLISKVIGFIPGGLLVVYIMSYPMWADMFARLGPSETYIVFSLAVCAWSMTKIVEAVNKKKAVELSTVIIWLVSTIISVGAKENLLLLIIPNMLLFIFLFYKKKLNPTIFTSFVLGLLFSFFVAFSVGKAVLAAGNDVYGQATTTESRFTTLITGMKHNDTKKMMAAGVIVTLLIIWQLATKRKDKKLMKASIITLSLFISYYFVFISQYVFYNGDWPNHSRYDFPGVLVIPMFYVTLIVFVNFLLARSETPKLVTNLLKYGIIVLLVVITAKSSFLEIRARVRDNATKTIVFTTRIESIKAKSLSNPSTPIVIESGNPWDYEPIFAYAEFLKAYGVKNDLYLRLHGYSNKTVKPGLEEQLTVYLEHVEKEGSEDFKALPGTLDNCYSVLLRPVKIDDCELL